MANNQNSTTGDQVTRYTGSGLTRHDFPSDFVFGAATSAYQVEGGYAEGHRSRSNWDAFSLQRPDKISGGGNGCVAIDHYNLFKEDVALMKKLGLDVYRLSLSWSRILPGGRLSSGVNREGVQFYNDLINLLLSEGIEPFVTIFHFDIPQCLEDEYGGFLDRRIVIDFAEYAEVCFFEFGDRVKYWITENEPWTYTHNGYITGGFPPAHGSPSEQPTETNVVKHRCALGVDNTCVVGNAGTEPYTVAHHLILAHAMAVDIYRKKFQAVQGGKIGVTNMTTWYDPYSTSEQDIDAARRAVEFMWGWFVAPIVTGDYPQVMRDAVQSRLPPFTPEESKLVKGSYDFIGMNYYTTNWAAYKPTPPGTPPTYYTDQEVEFFNWLFIVPIGIYKLLVYTKEKYNDPIIYITENGNSRIFYPLSSKKHFGYMLWSLFDNYEWAEGYSVRFGIYYVDYVHGLVRYPKNSAIWYMNFLNKNILARPKRQVEKNEEDNTMKRKKIR
ncbi:hypothetical protein Pfo_000098 [Paulownia fortunei]|nr:hypothetical protein Pfo_000098 [Paulownia fortunei]